MGNQLLRWWYRKKAKWAYLTMQDIRDDYSCGMHMLFEISPYARRTAIKFNKAMDELAKLDKHAPKYRYPVGEWK